jgi:hypothetical protein
MLLHVVSNDAVFCRTVTSTLHSVEREDGAVPIKVKGHFVHPTNGCLVKREETVRVE